MASQTLGTNFLIAVDNSEASEKAFAKAINMMNKMTHQKIPADTLAVLSVAEDISPAIGAPPYADLGYVIEANKAIESEHRKLLQKYGKICKEQNVECTLLLGHGQARTVIIEEAKKRQVDIIVVGRQGMSAIKRVFVGSHSRYVVENAPCTVVVVHV